MNTIKIYLAESGRIADLHKDFPLYQGQYQNKLLNVFVPTSLLAPEFVTLSDEGQTLSEYVAGTAVKIGMRYLTRSGEVKVSESRYMRYLKTLTYQNVEYALFERKLPKEFTLYEGQGANAPTLIINVVNIETDTDPNELLSIITSQTCSMDVMPSSSLDNDGDVEPSELDTINGRLNAIDETLTEKQDKIDESINITTDNEENTTWQDSQTVVGAINNNTAQTETNRVNIADNTSDIAQNTSDIAYLYAHAAQPEEYIGQMTGSVLPTDSQLTAFVEATVDREPKNADVVIFVLQVTGGTDKNYKYTYAVDGWNGYEIPAIEEAANGSLGLVKGTYNVVSANNTLVDIAGGEILNIYIKDENNIYRNIREYLNTNASNVANIVNGTTVVAKALNATNDSLGNNISTTYLTTNAGVTKTQMKEYALPRVFNDVSFLTDQDYSSTIPTSASPVYTVTTTSVGDFDLFIAKKAITNATFQLSNKNSYTNTIFASASANCTVQFRLTTEIYINDDWVTANVELSDEIAMVANEIKKLSFASTLNSLTEVLTINDGDKIRQTLEVITQSSQSTTFNIYSNETYPSTFYLNTTSETIILSQGKLGELPVFAIAGTLSGSKITFEIPSSASINNNVQAMFVLTYTGATTNQTEMELSHNSQAIQIVTPINNGTNNATTVANMTSKFASTINTWIFTGVFEVTSNTIRLIADVDKTSAGTMDYNDLSNKPSINSVTLSGNKTASDLSLATSAQGAKADTALQPADVDSALSTSSTNPVQNKVIAELIPTQASSSNQLADKNFVNSSISTNTANFIGTFANIPALNNYAGTITNNDYAFVTNSVITDNGNDFANITALNAYDKTLLTNFDYAWVINGSNFDLYRFDIENQTWDLRVQNTAKAAVTLNSAYNRYKASVSGTPATTTWLFEYTLNNSSFTAEQWAAINSGLTASDKTKLNGIEAGAQVNAVTSVNTKTGAVVLNADDISDTNTTNKFVTASDKTTWDGKQDALPTSSTAGQILKSTSTAGIVEWEDFGHIGEFIFLKPPYDLTIPNANDYTLTDLSAASSKGTALTWSGYPNYGVLIGAGVSKIKISFMANLYQNTATSNTRFSVVIKKNNSTDISYIWESGLGADKYVYATNVAAADVQEGDYIEFIVKSNGNATSGTRDKVMNMTRILIEVIE